MQIAVAIISCTTAFGLYRYYPWLSNKYSQVKTLYNLVSNINMNENSDKNEKLSFEIIGDCALIRYKYLGSEYEILVPYSRDNVIPMMDLDVEIIYEDSSRKINFQPGVPILVDNLKLKAKSIRVYNTDIDELKDYVGEVPYICYEVLRHED